MTRLLALVLLAIVAMPAHAARSVTSGLMTYGSQTNDPSVTVPPSAAISTAVTVNHTSGGGN